MTKTNTMTKMAVHARPKSHCALGKKHFVREGALLLSKLQCCSVLNKIAVTSRSRQSVFVACKGKYQTFKSFRTTMRYRMTTCVFSTSLCFFD